MLIKLFDIQNDKVVPTEHCYTLKFLKTIMDKYPENYLKIYQYLWYTSCPHPDNPMFNLKEDEKEDLIIEECDIDFSLDDEDIEEALNKCQKLYETPTSRAYNGLKKALDNIADYMADAEIIDGRDGNITQIARVAKDFDGIRQSYKGVYKDLKEEQEMNPRGGKNLGYDG